MVDQPLLSIVVTSFSAEHIQDIFELFDSVRSQTYPHLELIFVAEQSGELFEHVNTYAAGNPELDMHVLFNDGETGLSAARNLAVGKAKGSIISFIDDDVVLFPDWAEEMVKAYKDESIIGVTGPAVPLWEDESESWFPEEFYWIISCTAWNSWDEPREVRNAWGMNMSFRRRVFQQCGMFSNEHGYHKGPMAEDNEYSARVKKNSGGKILYHPAVKVWHRVYKFRLSGKFIRTRSFWIGYSRRALRRHPSETGVSSSDILNTERDLIKRIATGLVPDILNGFFHQPRVAWVRFKITSMSLLFVALGYIYSGLLPKSRVFTK